MVETKVATMMTFIAVFFDLICFVRLTDFLIRPENGCHYRRKSHRPTAGAKATVKLA
jgi:hypothetical protein